MNKLRQGSSQDFPSKKTVYTYDNLFDIPNWTLSFTINLILSFVYLNSSSLMPSPTKEDDHGSSTSGKTFLSSSSSCLASFFDDIILDIDLHNILLYWYTLMMMFRSLHLIWIWIMKNIKTFHSWNSDNMIWQYP